MTTDQQIFLLESGSAIMDMDTNIKLVASVLPEPDKQELIQVSYKLLEAMKL